MSEGIQVKLYDKDALFVREVTLPPWYPLPTKITFAGVTYRRVFGKEYRAVI